MSCLVQVGRMEADRRETRRQEKQQVDGNGPSLIGTGMKKRGKMAGRSKHGRTTDAPSGEYKGGSRGKPAGGASKKRMSQGSSLRKGRGGGGGGGSKRRGGKS